MLSDHVMALHGGSGRSVIAVNYNVLFIMYKPNHLGLN